LRNPADDAELNPPVRFHRVEKRHAAFSSYCRHLRRRDLSPRSIETYADCLHTFAHWLDTHRDGNPLSATFNDLEAFRLWLVTEHDRKVSVGRQSTYVAVLRAFYRYLHAEMLVLTDPAKALQYPRLERRIHRDILTPAELRDVMSRPADTPRGLRDRVTLRLFALSGPRARELTMVDVEDVFLKDREMLVRKGKGARQRIAFFDRDTQSHLARYLASARPRLARDDERALLVDNKGKRATSAFLRDIVKYYGRRIRRNITPHSFRRTFCTLMLRAGANLKVIAELAGHELLSTTARYTKVDISELSAIYQAAHPRASR
jgi:site-specific recombinase XerD